MSSLSHHGIKGQRWGVRRFQNKDGTRTALGKHRDFERTASKVVDDLSNSPQPFIRRPLNKDKIRQRGLITQAEADQCAGLAAGVFKQASKVEPQITGDVIDVVSSTSAKMYGLNNRLKQPTSIAAKIGSDAKSDGVTFEQAANGLKDVIRYTAVSDSHNYVDTYNAIKQRLENKGYTEIKCKNYFQKYQNGEVMHKAVQSTFRSPDGVDFEFQFQTPESQAAKELKVPIYNERRKAGNTPERNMELEQKMRNLAEQVPDPEGVFEIKSHSGVTNSNKVNHTSIGGTMYIEGNALILGDSSYLEHHGIRGQRWGVRRFQNRDGSLTNAGRKRLGYATKGATQAVKKAFNAGVKTGAKAVKAAKAHHEKAEAKKIEKKKEKASKTRAGVSANKDLFTAKELKELNAKFEEQDKLTMARIKHGVEIAKAVGETAKSVGEVGKAYEALTGHKLVPDIVTLQNGGSIDFNNKDKGKDTDKDTAKDKDKAKDKDDDPPKPPNDGGGGGDGGNPPSNQPPGKGSNWTNTPPDLPTPQSKSKWGARKKDSDGDSDLQSQMEAVKKQASKAMKNAKLQEYIDAYNRDQNSEKNRELTSRGQKAIELLSKGGGFTSEEPKLSAPSTPKSVPSSNNLMAQIRAAQTKLEKPNKNETPAERKEAQKKLNALEKVANEYKAAANKPGADPAEITEKLLKKNKNILDDIKHMDFSDTDYLEHYGVRGMKWGKHLMAGKGGGIYDGTALGGGGGGGPMTEEERKKAEELRKKKLEEAKKKAEEAAKEKGIEEKAKEIGISAKAYKRYSIDNNHLPGKRHYDKSQKLHGEASSSVAESQAAERQAHMNRAKAASLMRKVNSSHMFDADGYHISQQRGDDRKEAKRLQKEAKQLDKKSKKALKKFYKKRYKSDKERQKWQNSTSGKYHHMMRHYEIQNGVLFINAGEPYLEHHGVKGMKWGKHLMAGKGEAGAGGGGGEDDEKLKEMAKKAGMSVAEYKQKFAGKIGGAAAKAKKEIGYAYGSEYKKDFEKAARLHENNSRSMREQAKAAWEGYGESRTAAQKDNWKRYAEYDRQAAASGNMFVKRERSKQAYDNSLASKVDSAKRKARLTQDKAKSKISDTVDAAKKTRDDVKSNIRSKTGIGVKKDIIRNARLAEGQKRRAHELTKQVYAAKNKDDWARAYSESNKESFKAGDNEHKVNKDTKSYPKSIAGRVGSAKRKAHLTKDKLKSALGKSKQRKQLTTEGPKAKKQISDARNSVEKAARSNEAAYRHAKEVYRQTGGDSDAYKQAIKRSRTTLQRSLESQKRLKQKKKAKHFDDTNAVYTEGTRLVIHPKA